MMNESNIPVSGIVMMIKNEDGSFSPIGFTDKSVKNLLNEFLMGGGQVKKFRWFVVMINMSERR